MFLKQLCNRHLYSTGNNLELAKIDPQTDFKAISDWFFENYMILNSEKCHYMPLGETVQMINLYTMTKSLNTERKKQF